MSLKTYLTSITTERSPVPEVISFRAIRQAIGWLGMLLPLALAFGNWVVGQCCILQPSISHYYYTNMRELFVGTLCAVALFLFTYKGHSKLDSYAANGAGLFCLGIAIFPTTVAALACQAPVTSIFGFGGQWKVHYACAALFFLVLAYMSGFLFTKSNVPADQRTVRKRQRNLVYIVCAVIMVVCIMVIGVVHFFFEPQPDSTLTYWLEALALVAFGVSWLTKGEAMLRD